MDATTPSSAVFMRALKKAVERAGRGRRTWSSCAATSVALFGLFDTTLVVSWLYPGDDEQQRRAVEKDANDLLAAMPGLIEVNRIGGETLEEAALHRLALGASERRVTAAEWSRLFAETLARDRAAARATGREEQQ